MAILISDQLLHEQQLDESRLRMEIAIILYEKEVLSLGQAHRMAKMDRIEFEAELGKRNIFLPYSETDLEADLQTLKNLRKHDRS